MDIIVIIGGIGLYIGLFIIGKLSINTRRLLFDKIYNNTRNKLYEILYKETDTLTGNTVCEKALIRYFNNKLSSVYSAYEEVKLSNNINLIDNVQFSNRLLGDGYNELESIYLFFPKEFLVKINNINKINYDEFKENLKTSLTFSYKKGDLLQSLKTHTINSFRKNIKVIYQLYKDTRHLICDPEYMEIYSELFKNSKIAVIEETTKTEYLTFNNVVTLDKIKIKNLITLGLAGLDQALYFLNIFTKDSYEKNKEVVMMLSRLSEYNKNQRLGLDTPENELNKITSSTLEILDKL